VFERLTEELVTVEIEGLQAFLSARDVPAIRRRKPTATVRLLPNFDQYVLASGRNDEAAKHRAKVSRQAGWISKA
jgi:hypothetical protein